MPNATISHTDAGLVMEWCGGGVTSVLSAMHDDGYTIIYVYVREARHASHEAGVSLNAVERRALIIELQRQEEMSA